jgi:hypothetical protein
MNGIRRPLSAGERKMARTVFGDAVDYDRVTVNRRKWFPFQPAKFVMSPDGHIWVHPRSNSWADDYATARLGLQELFIHEMTHVWQAQIKGKFYLALMRHPFCRYDYEYRPGWRFEDYGLEQQAEIVRHVWMWRSGWIPKEAPPLELLEPLLPFGEPSAAA